MAPKPRLLPTQVSQTGFANRFRKIDIFKTIINKLLVDQGASNPYQRIKPRPKAEQHPDFTIAKRVK